MKAFHISVLLCQLAQGSINSITEASCVPSAFSWRCFLYETLALEQNPFSFWGSIGKGKAGSQTSKRIVESHAGRTVSPFLPQSVLCLFILGRKS